MAESGEIQIDILVNAQEAAKELSEVDKSLLKLADAANEAGVDFEALTNDVDAAAKQIADQLGVSFGEAKKSLKKFKDQMNDTADTGDNIVGLESLKDSTGELDSSLKGLGGAVGLVSPEMERLLFVTGELSGGIEASSRLTMLAGGSFKTLLASAGLLGVGVGALGGAFVLMSRKVKAAEERLKESHEAMVEGIAFAKQYKNQLQGLQNTVGLLSDEEFALIDARQKSDAFMKEEIEGQKAKRTVVVQLRKEIERLEQEHANLSEMIGTNIRVSNNFGVSTFDVAEAMRLTQEQIEAGEPILVENGRGFQELGHATARTGEAADLAANNIANLRGKLTQFQREIDSTERKGKRLNLLFQIQAAQAREDNDAIRSLALSMALLDDVLASEAVAALNAAKGHAILTVQLQNLGAATGPAVAAIDQMFDRLIDNAAPEAFAETFAKLKVSAEDAADAVNSSTDAATKDAEAEAEAAELAALRAQKLDMLAEAQGELAVIDREYAKAREEIIELDQKLGLTTEEMTILFKGAMDERQEAIENFNDEQRQAFEASQALAQEAVALEVTKAQAIEDQYQEQLDALEDFHEKGLISDQEYADKSVELEKQRGEQLAALRREQAQSVIATAQMVTGIFETLVSSQVERITTELEAEKAAALERAGEDQEKIQQINEEFEKRKQKELADSFKKQRALEVANALASAASASVAALAPPPTGLGPVFGYALLPVIAATLGTQLAAIKAQQPTFHSGGIVDGSAGADVPITAQQGEVVLSRDAVASLGGPAQANALNTSGGQSGPVVIELTYRQKVFDRVVVDSLAKGGPLKNALNSAANAGRRGRIGGRL